MAVPLLIVALSLTGSGCGPHNISVRPLLEFPQPLVEPINAQVGVYFPPEFSEFSYHEKRPGAGGGEWNIALGATQVQVFHKVLSSMFSGFRELESLDAADAGLKAVIVPKVAEFQFALPADTKATVFEIWVKYDLSIRDSSGEEVGHWVFTAYGKTPTAMLKSSDEAIQAATLVALRDAGASMISGLKRDARIREWLGVPLQQAPQKAPDETALPVDDAG